MSDKDVHTDQQPTNQEEVTLNILNSGPSTSSTRPVVLHEQYLLYGGLVLLVAALALFIISLITAEMHPDRGEKAILSNTASEMAVRLLNDWFPQILTIIVGFFLALLGVRLLRAGGVSSRYVIPTQEFGLLGPLVAGGNANAIDQYVRLSSLSGFTGTFTKLGLTGLPFATIGLTIFFALLLLLRHEHRSYDGNVELKKRG